ncbi:MAG: phosphoglycerate dehydrogenase [Actinomycetota bacterium]
MKILYADSVDESGPDRLRAAGHECEVNPALSADDLPDVIAGYDALVVRSTKVTAATIEAATCLGLIVRAGAGTDNIDKDAASGRGVFVCNVPGRNAIAVAELTMGLLLAIDRRIPHNVTDLQAGTWNKAEFARADGLYGKRLGIIGLGDIGLAVAERARAFGLTVATVRRPDRPASTQSAIRTIGIRLVETIDELLETSDIVSLHVPKNADTVGLVDQAFLAKLTPGAILLNTSRGEVVDGDALLDALDSGDLRAGLDVWPDEPSGGKGSFDSALARHPRVVGTHHIGASTGQAQRSVSEGVVDVIESYLAGSPIGCVNLRSDPSGTCALAVRHLDKVGVLAQVLGVLRTGGINVQQMRNQVFLGGQAAVATINVDPDPTPEVIEALGAIDEVLNVAVVDPTPA